MKGKNASHFFTTMTSGVWGPVMARRSAYDEKGLFNPPYGFTSDLDMWLRLAHGSDAAHVPEPPLMSTLRQPNHAFAIDNWRHHMGIAYFMEAFTLWKDADDDILRSLGYCICDKKYLPD